MNPLGRRLSRPGSSLITVGVVAGESLRKIRIRGTSPVMCPACHTRRTISEACEGPCRCSMTDGMDSTVSSSSGGAAYLDMQRFRANLPEATIHKSKIPMIVVVLREDCSRWQEIALQAGFDPDRIASMEERRRSLSAMQACARLLNDWRNDSGARGKRPFRPYDLLGILRTISVDPDKIETLGLHLPPGGRRL